MSKFFRKSLAFFCALALLLTVVPTALPSLYATESSNQTLPLVEKELPGMTSENTLELSKNPDRGYRMEIHLDIKEIADDYALGTDKMVSVAYNRIMERVAHYGNDNVNGYWTVAIAYIWLDEYKATGLDEAAIAAVDACLVAYRKAGIKVRLNFAYQQAYEADATATDEEKTGASTDVILSDIEKLGPIIEKNKDVIYALQISFLGAFGEWHSQVPEVDKARVIEAIADICPNDTYMLARLPEYKNLLSKEHPAYNRIGFTDDAFFGAEQREGTGQNAIYPGTDAWNQWVSEGINVPNDGEMFTSEWFVENTINNNWHEKPNLWLAIEEMYKLHFSTFSFYHGYLDYSNAGITSIDDTIIGEWKKITVSESDLNQPGRNFPYSQNWFKDANGNTVERTAYEYIRDHLGYYLEAQSVNVTKSEFDNTINVKMPVKNYGFAAPFNMESGFAILDANNQVVSSVKAGSPSLWKAQADSYDINASSLVLPTKAGTYRLAFYLKNNIGQSARLANNIEYINGYNVIHTFDVEDTYLIGATRLDGAQLANVNADLRDNSSSPWSCTASSHTMMGTTTATVTNAVFEGSQGVNFTYTGDAYSNNWKTDSAGYSRTHRLFMKNINSSVALKDGSILFYIKLPKLAGKTTTAIGVDLRTNTDYLLKGAAKAYVLKKGQSAWEEITADSKDLNSTEAWATSFFELETGFEGFIRIPTVGAYCANGTYVTEDTQLNLSGIALNIQDMNKYTQLLIGPVFWVNNSSNPAFADGGKGTMIQVKNANNALEICDLAAAPYMKGIRLDGAQGSGDVNASLADGGGHWKDTASTTLGDGSVKRVVTDSFNMEGFFGIELTRAAGYSRDWKTNGYTNADPRIIMKSINNITLQNGSILFYVKLPKLDKEKTAINLYLRDTTDNEYYLKGISSFYVLENGKSQWVAMQTASKTAKISTNVSDYSFLELKSGFEGYIRIPLGAYYLNKNYTPVRELDTIKLAGMALSVQDLSNNGKLVVGPILWTNNDVDAAFGNGGTGTSIEINGSMKDLILETFMTGVRFDGVQAAENEGVDLQSNSTNAWQRWAHMSGTAGTVKSVITDSFGGDKLGIELTQTTAISQDWATGGYMRNRILIPNKNAANGGTVNVKSGSSLLVYLKLPNISKDTTAVSFELKAYDQEFFLKGNPTAYILEKGASTWEKIQGRQAGSSQTPDAVLAHTSFFTLPSGFEGYIRLPVNGAFYRPAATTALSNADRDFQGFMLSVQDVPANGKLIVGPLVIASPDTDNYDAFVEGGTGSLIQIDGAEITDMLIDSDDKRIKGDLNSDGMVNPIDMTILRIVLFNDDTSDIYDVNGDGFTNICDLVRLKKIMIGVA